MQPTNDPSLEILRQHIQAQTAAYIDSGGRIDTLPPQEFTYRLSASAEGGTPEYPVLVMCADKRKDDGSRERVHLMQLRGLQRAAAVRGGV